MSKDKDIFAFPNTSDYTHKNGMTLRDYFAAMAMQPMFEVWEDFEDWGFEELAMRSYEMADAMLKERGEMSGDHNEHQKPYSYLDFECPRCGHCCKTDLAKVGEVGVWGQCEPQPALEDGWSDWVCPKPHGYLMQCCDCELIHEVDFRVVKYESEDSEVYEVVDDPNLQAQMRMKRRDDLSPKHTWVGLTDEEISAVDWKLNETLHDYARHIELKLRGKNT